MGGWKFPANLKKNIDLKDLDEIRLREFHDNLHILWGRLEEGYELVFPDVWTFNDLYIAHKAAAEELMLRGLGHLAPINELDVVGIHQETPEKPIKKKKEETQNIKLGPKNIGISGIKIGK